MSYYAPASPNRSNDTPAAHAAYRLALAAWYRRRAATADDEPQRKRYIIRAYEVLLTRDEWTAIGTAIEEA